ncbi:gibberellin-regulated protein 12-like [Gastrolobium bilobum]|uniref:gibberellin-regulated protein 12-like n=1 Tax=Gastrolobium bilobum TaxID=150636 RepID=UPI002AB1584B|nr:gibberellin-regulated protein 12-like [Gastrolobium bilobum]
MAKIVGLVYAFLIIFVMDFALQVAYAGGEGSLRPKECGNACAYRCSKTHHKKPCLFFCNKCCQKCLCVPSGTYAHKDECPCYNNWQTKEGKPKCP